ncbi:hypothetical protein B0T21DRAFT_136218 [Apiosordaria backusii]|uniref:Uncharacterized protein n=1 Tax=Apiosordaria backusii TaxID=314023 RepID=A0AA40BRG1_9PEZI|nr:hypothetical protein B0T21DRAFT_136218 [Apiosordaria backusii]
MLALGQCIVCQDSPVTTTRFSILQFPPTFHNFIQYVNAYLDTNHGSATTIRLSQEVQHINMSGLGKNVLIIGANRDVGLTLVKAFQKEKYRV